MVRIFTNFFIYFLNVNLKFSSFFDILDESSDFFGKLFQFEEIFEEIRKNLGNSLENFRVFSNISQPN